MIKGVPSARAVQPIKVLTAEPSSVIHPSILEIWLFRIARWGLVAVVALLYLASYQWNFFLTPLLVLGFTYSFSGLAQLLIDAVVYFLTQPLLLQEREEISHNGIPANIKIALVRPIFAKTNPEMESLLSNLRLDALANQEPGRNIKFIVIDNTRERSVREYTRGRIRELQAEWGEDLVFYLHRNPKVDFFKKVGIYQDLVLFLREGKTRPSHYIDPKWIPWTQGKRDPKEPLWDEILGDLRGLGFQSSVEDVLKGRDIPILDEERVKYALVCDADNRWPEGAVRKLVAKMAHPANQGITIFQPTIEISNSDENWFLRLASWGRGMTGFDPVAKWRLYRFSPFYGKGGMNLDRYLQEVIRTEALHPAQAASHDFQESLWAWCALVEDVSILERSFSNKLSELTRASQWMWGDMETVRQYLFQGFETGRKEHLWMLLRISVGNLIFAFWVLATCLAWLFPILGGVRNPWLLWALFGAILSANLFIPKFLIPYWATTRSSPEGSVENLEKNVAKLVEIALVEASLTTLIHLLDLFYRSKAFIRNLLWQLKGKDYVWITSAMGELKATDLSLLKCYEILWPTTVLGLLLGATSLFKIFPLQMVIFLIPFTASFLLGPAAIEFTSRAAPKKEPEETPG